MIKYTGLLLISFLFFGCSASEKTSTEKPANSEEIVYEVYGMDCPGCEGGLEKLLNKNEVVIDSEADWVNKKVVIYIEDDKKLSDEEIEEIIKKANFTPGGRIEEEENK